MNLYHACLCITECCGFIITEPPFSSQVSLTKPSSRPLRSCPVGGVLIQQHCSQPQLLCMGSEHSPTKALKIGPQHLPLKVQTFLLPQPWKQPVMPILCLQKPSCTCKHHSYAHLQRWSNLSTPPFVFIHRYLGAAALGTFPCSIIKVSKGPSNSFTIWKISTCKWQRHFCFLLAVPVDLAFACRN